MHQTVFFGYGMLIALGTTLLLGRSRDLYVPHLMTVLFLTLGGAVFGAAALGFAIHRELGVASMGAVFGGGALAVATVGYFFPDASHKRTAYDVLISACVLGLLTTRVGCHFNGCDIGAQTEWFWGVVPNLPFRRNFDYTHPVHPFAWLIIIPTAMVFVGAWLKQKRPGHIAVTIAFGYLVIRFIAEFFRAPSGLTAAGLHYNQWFVIAGLVLTYLWSRRMLADD